MDAIASTKAGAATIEDVGREAAERGASPIDAVVSAGLASEPQAYETLAAAARMPFVNASSLDPSVLAVRMVPARVARRHGLVPFQLDDKRIDYAIGRPFDDDADRDLGFLSGRRASAHLACPADIDRLLDRCYPKAADLETLVGRIRSSAAVETIDEVSAGPADSAVVELCNHLIARAVEAGASDIHLDNTHEGGIVRFRVAGILEPVLTLPPAAAQPVCNRFKVIARADIAVKLRPQDGAFAVRLDGRRIDVRFSAVPTITGEKLVMRVIDSRSTLQTIETIGYPEDLQGQLRQALNRPDGLVLVTGPTGSGKTTVLYAALDYLRSRRVNIVSVEDPVERRLAGVSQIPVNARAGSTFAAALRSVLRQDPNVIMVGEIRDGEVAGILGQAAYTGHLVLSSLHTTDAVTAVTRLVNLGLEPYKIAESLSVIVAQRLVRALCPHCRQTLSEFEGTRLARERHLSRVAAAAGPGCMHCRFTGYSGRVPIVELLAPDAALREAIAQGATAGELRGVLKRRQWPTLHDCANQLLADGITSADEIGRVLADEGEIRTDRASSRTVLVAEDDSITRMLVKLLLERDGYTVLEAANGRQAVEVAAREHPSLMVMDLNMPEMDGYEAIKHVRRVPTLAAVPILVVTSEDGPGVETKVLQLGADDYVLKPFDPGVLSSRVQAAFRRLQMAAA